MHGRWMAAVLTCGPDAVLSHESAGHLWRIRTYRSGLITLSMPAVSKRCHLSIRVHRRANLRPTDITTHHGIPVTTPVCTLIDLATELPDPVIERAVNEADKLDLVDPERLRRELDDTDHRPGAPNLRRLLDRRTFTLTDSELERRFLKIARRVGLPKPPPKRRVNGFDVDFFWPDLGLVVETDGLRYHRTPAEQAKDRLRDQIHAAAGLTPLRYTRAQVHYDPEHVEATLAAVTRRLACSRV